MKAVRLYGKQDVRVVDIAKPQPLAGQVLIKVAAAGVCHSDLHLIHDGRMDAFAPFTLGHENVGWVEEVGEGVTGFAHGDAVAVYGPWGCGYCHSCQRSAENYCENQAKLGKMAGGIGHDGGMAEYMIVPHSRLLIPIGGLDPVQAAPLTDAALTPYHAVKRSLHKLTPDAFVVVIGIGGLGHMAIQILKAMCSSTIIACDVNDARMQLGLKHGADYVVNTASATAADDIIKITGEKKSAVVFDFVGVDPTMALGRKVSGLDSDWTIVGLGGGSFPFTYGSTPFGCSVCTPYWGSRTELIEVLTLAERGVIGVEVQRFPLEEALEVYALLEAGKINGRAVLIP